MKKQSTSIEALSKFKTQYNAKNFPKNWEKVIGVSETIPDQSYSIREILTKFVLNPEQFKIKNMEYPETEPDYDSDLLMPGPGEDFQDIYNQRLEILESIENKKQARLELWKKQQNLLKINPADKKPDETQK